MSGRRSIGGFVVVLFFALLAYAPFPAAVQDTRDQPPPPPTFRTEANYVRVDVYATRSDRAVADLTRDDFEVLDNGTPQRIEQFERVVVRAAGAQEARIEPNTVRESRSMLESARARVFVLFLDLYHVEPEASRTIQKPLIEALDKMIGADDLIGIMTPEMSARDIAFARKTTTIAGILSRYWWGERGSSISTDPEEQKYQACYPGFGPGPGSTGDDRGIALEMIKRRREKRTLDALDDLVRYLQTVREERKGVLAITDGWLLYGRNPALEQNQPRAPRGPQIGVDPRNGRLATDAPRAGSGDATCDSDLIALANLDDEQLFRRIQDEANRANTSFYPIDPRGLVVFDTPIVEQGTLGPPPPTTPVSVDAAMLRTRTTSLRRLAEGTDGLAIVDTNNIAGSLKRVVDDLTSYYLLGYYASGKLDGKFHSIQVRVKRPDVRIRARRGYLAASEAEARSVAVVAARGSSAEAVPAAEAAETRAIETALLPLDGYVRQLPVRVHAAAGWKPGNAAGVWAIGELGAGPEWRGGADADLSLASAAGATLATAHARIEPGNRSFRVSLTPDQQIAPGDYLLRVRVKGGDATASASETLRLALVSAPDSTGAIFTRRGPSTANREVPTSDLRFRRSEQLRLEIANPADAAFTGRLLDRTGKPLAVPVTMTVRDDPDGSRWQVAQISLAPLAPADYLIEVVQAERRSLFGFRVIP